METNNMNGNRVVWFLLKTAVSLVLALSLAYAGWTTKAISAITERVDRFEQRIAVIDAKLDLILQELKHAR